MINIVKPLRCKSTTYKSVKFESTSHGETPIMLWRYCGHCGAKLAEIENDLRDSGPYNSSLIDPLSERELEVLHAHSPCTFKSC